MTFENLVHQCSIHLCDRDYEVLVYRRDDGSHVAKTVFAPDDVILHDGPTLDEVLDRHQRLLPLAINSRHILSEFRRGS